MKREWTVDTITPEGEFDFSPVHASVDELVTILLRLGGVGGMVPRRVQANDGEYYVDRVMFKYDSYAPGVNRRPPEQAEESIGADPVPVTVAADGEGADGEVE